MRDFLFADRGKNHKNQKYLIPQKISVTWLLTYTDDSLLTEFVFLSDQSDASLF